MGWVPAGPAPPQAATTSSEKGPRLPLKATGLEAQALRQGNLSGPWPRERNLVLGEDRGTRAQGRAALAPGSPFGPGRLLQVAGRSYFLGLIKPGDPRSRGQGPSVGGRPGSALQYPQWGRSQHALLQGGGLGAHARSSEGEPARWPRVHLRQVPSCNSASSGGRDVAWQSRPEQGDRDAACEAGSRAATVASQEPGERSPDLVPWGGGHHVPVPRSPGPQRRGAGGALTLLAWIRWKFFPCTRKPCSKFLHSSSLQAQSPSATGGQRRQQRPGRGGCRGWSGRAGTHLG